MKKILFSALVLIVMLAMLLCGCGEQKTLHCDNCGADVMVSANSNMTDEWSIFCAECDEKLFADDPVLNGD